MTAIQSQSIPAMIAGNDIVAQAPTGTGKTCSFGIPVVETQIHQSVMLHLLFLRQQES